jgi:hypothetical protein
MRLGFVAEFSFQNTHYEENSRRAELRPILDREFSHWQIVLNPVFERALHGPGTNHGWNFEPAGLIRWKREKLSPSLEYYGEIESIDVRPHFQPEVHQLFAGGDWEARPDFSINFGLGFDLGDRGPGIVVKSRFEWHWGTRSIHRCTRVRIDSAKSAPHDQRVLMGEQHGVSTGFGSINSTRVRFGS